MTNGHVWRARTIVALAGLTLGVALCDCGGGDDDTASGATGGEPNAGQGAGGRGGGQGAHGGRGGAGPSGGLGGKGGSSQVGGASGQGGEAGGEPSGAGGMAGISLGGEGGVPEQPCPNAEVVLTAFWSPLDDAPSARAYGALAATPATGELVLFGGASLLSGGSADTWLYSTNEALWTPGRSEGPAARAGHTLIGFSIDSGTENAAMLFGGSAGPALGDTWLWHGGVWGELCDGQSCPAPPARSGHAVAYDSLRGKVVLFGGHDGGSALADTWEWTNTDGWVEVCKAGCTPPPARFDHGMAFDAKQNRVLMYGGTNGGADTSDLWAWDGETWAELGDGESGPGARAGHVLGYDSTHDLTVVFGGVHGGEMTNDVWAYRASGGDWVRGVAGSSAPPPRAYAAATWDPNDEGFVIFGGGVAGELSDTWQLKLGDPTSGTTPCSCAVACRAACPFLSQVTCLSLCDQGVAPEAACSTPSSAGGTTGQGTAGGG